jgi:hypothetical protein
MAPNLYGAAFFMLFAPIAFILALWGRKINRKRYKSELFFSYSLLSLSSARASFSRFAA